MNAQQVVEKILSEANAEAEKIKTEAADKAAAQTAATEAQIAEYSKQTAQLAAEAGEDKKSRLLAAARMSNRKQALAVRVQLLNEVFKKAVEKVNSLPEGPYQELMTAFMVKSVQTGDEQVVVGKNEKRIDDKMIKNVNRQLGPGFRGNLQLASQRGNFGGGFILKRGRIQINVTSEVLVSQVREKLEMELTGDMFGE